MRSRPQSYVLALLAFALPAYADGPVLHEYIAPDAAEDLRMGATTQDGAMPAAIDTRSGVLAAPASRCRRGRSRNSARHPSTGEGFVEFNKIVYERGRGCALTRMCRR